MDIEIDIKAIMKNACEPSDLAAMKMTPIEWVKYMVDEEGLAGLIDLDEFEIVQATFKR